MRYFRYCLIVGLIATISACSSKRKTVEKAEEPQSAEATEPQAEGLLLRAQPLARTTFSQELEWSYADATGPANWGDLDPKFSLCSSGKAQSPIDLVFKKPNPPNEIIFDYRDSVWVLLDRKPFFAIHPGGNNTAYFAGSPFTLKEVTLHISAEHTFSGKRHPLEVHLYHESETGEMLVVSSIFTESEAEHPTMAQLLNQIPLADQKDFQVIEPLALGRLLPEVRSYYHYMGSLTYPPCTEGVHRVVFNTPLSLSSAQLARLKALVGQNQRPTQPRNDRKIENYRAMDKSP